MTRGKGRRARESNPPHAVHRIIGLLPQPLDCGRDLKPPLIILPPIHWDENTITQYNRMFQIQLPQKSEDQITIIIINMFVCLQLERRTCVWPKSRRAGCRPTGWRAKEPTTPWQTPCGGSATWCCATPWTCGTRTTCSPAHIEHPSLSSFTQPTWGHVFFFSEFP